VLVKQRQSYGQQRPLPLPRAPSPHVHPTSNGQLEVQEWKWRLEVHWHAAAGGASFSVESTKQRTSLASDNNKKDETCSSTNRSNINMI
jgi:hypothetical protein